VIGGRAVNYIGTRRASELFRFQVNVSKARRQSATAADDSVVRYSEDVNKSPMPLRREGPGQNNYLPLPLDTFDVLVSLADRDRHGDAILQDIAERTDGRIRLSPSTLYAVIKRLLESELIEELSERPDPAHDDERRRYYRLTPLCRRVAESEAARLTRLLADARASGLVPRRR
jgi:DNA-binding MarR family transcriptional regulator